jgi:hypothetical protein
VKYRFSNYDALRPRFRFNEKSAMQAILPPTKVQASSQTRLSASLLLDDL